MRSDAPGVSSEDAASPRRRSNSRAALCSAEDCQLARSNPSLNTATVAPVGRLTLAHSARRNNRSKMSAGPEMCLHGLFGIGLDHVLGVFTGTMDSNVNPQKDRQVRVCVRVEAEASVSRACHIPKTAEEISRKEQQRSDGRRRKEASGGRNRVMGDDKKMGRANIGVDIWR